ncbi:hypothetical protein M4R23_07315 [Acidovorax sp. GBBC 3332]|nr:MULTISPECIES: hypothetical protein [unclassified Acidovorax]MDA8449218.1 hypothetical protein [Acidovorax sp. GBBC 3297]MDA8458694.1 hypothetical protein [Acidovorax sp. GBBC 3333]MDA8463974.1 hypothetical protein [Acidovorax sp. GBBC 3332]MDA8469006.1 hypothetical protein [Acidovorax sp. GBBC 3299]WCM80604.1 hypothetical protein M5C94_10120 [Acidovorax sp. GBBC 712]
MDSTSRHLLRTAMLAAVTTTAAATAAEPTPPAGQVIQGLGERIPAGAKNISLSPQFKVYKFERDGVTYVQINSLQDEVLTALIVTPGVQQQLPIGSAAGTPVVFVDPQKLP